MARFAAGQGAFKELGGIHPALRWRIAGIITRFACHANKVPP